MLQFLFILPKLCYTACMEKNIVGRFAPSPSGYMHMGNLLSMLLAWLDCRALGGEMVFRMEDLDPARSKQVYIDALSRDLNWLGLDWDRGWPEAGYAQSGRTAFYAEVFQTLKEKELVYPCWCSRAERLAAASAPHEGEAQADPGCRCAHLGKEERLEKLRENPRCAWKLRAPDRVITLIDGHFGTYSRNPAREGGDCIVRRADGVYAYQLAVSADDLAMGVTRVVRGRDLLPSAPLQAFLIETLGGRAPMYCHAPLLTDGKGQGKLSKRIGSLSTELLRAQYTPQALCGHLAHLCGLIDRGEPVTPQELVPEFSWEKIKKEDIAI